MRWDSPDLPLFFPFLVFLLALAFLDHSARAQCLPEEIRALEAPDRAVDSHFGESVALSRERAVVGAPNHLRDGAVYVFRHDGGTTWTLEQQLLPPERVTRSRFGGSVAIHGNVIVVGADRDGTQTTDAGAAYVFRWDGRRWNEEQKLLASTGALGASFGASVAVFEERVLVGAPFLGLSSPPGRAFVYRWNGMTWDEEQQLIPSDASPGDMFGRAVALTEDLALVGAPHRFSQDDTGGAYFFRWDGVRWSEEQKLVASAPRGRTDLGSAVALSGETALVGAPGDRENGVLTGAVYVFQPSEDGWVEAQKLLGEGTLDLFFGTSVSASGNHAIIGAFGGTPGPGAYAYFREGDTWMRTQRFTSAHADNRSEFGTTVAVHGETLLVGARTDDGGAVQDSGTAFLFTQNLRSGTVDLGEGPVIDTLFVNDSQGGPDRIVSLAAGEPTNLRLFSSPSGPLGTYVLWIWEGTTNGCHELVFDGQVLGRTVNPTPLHVGQSPQPIGCLVGRNVPPAACGSTPVRLGPSVAPWTLTGNAPRRPGVFTIQGVIRDAGSASGRGLSVTNAVEVRIE